MPNNDSNSNNLSNGFTKVTIAEVCEEDFKRYRAQQAQQRTSNAVGPFDGEIIDGEIKLTVPAGTIDVLKRIASTRGTSLDEVINDVVISQYLECMYGTPPTEKEKDAVVSSLLEKLRG